MGNRQVALGCALIAIMLVLLTLFGAWYSVGGETEIVGITKKVTFDMGV